MPEDERMAEGDEDEGLGAIAAGLLGAGLGGLLGHAAGRGQGYQEGYRDGYAKGKEEAVAPFRERLEDLKRARIIRQAASAEGRTLALSLSGPRIPGSVMRPLEEAAGCYVFGQPRSCCVMAGVAVEAALKAKWKMMKRTDAASASGLHDMIEWALREGVLDRENAQVAHTVRILQNVYKHDDKILADTDPIAVLGGSLRVASSLF